MAISSVKIHGGSGAWLLPCVLSSGKLDDTFGTVIKPMVVSRVGVEYPIGTESTDEQFVEVSMANGVLMQKDARTQVVDGAGATKSGGTDNVTGVVSFDMHENDVAMLTSLQAIGDVPVVCVVPLGETGAEGYAYLLGRFATTVAVEKVGNQASPISVQIKGKAYELDTTGGVTATSFNTAMLAALTSITQYGTSEVLAPATDAPTVDADIVSTAFLGGNVVFKS